MRVETEMDKVVTIRPEISLMEPMSQSYVADWANFQPIGGAPRRDSDDDDSSEYSFDSDGNYRVGGADNTDANGTAKKDGPDDQRVGTDPRAATTPLDAKPDRDRFGDTRDATGKAPEKPLGDDTRDAKVPEKELGIADKPGAVQGVPAILGDPNAPDAKPDAGSGSSIMNAFSRDDPDRESGKHSSTMTAATREERTPSGQDCAKAVGDIVAAFRRVTVTPGGDSIVDVLARIQTSIDALNGSIQTVASKMRPVQ